MKVRIFKKNILVLASFIIFFSCNNNNEKIIENETTIISVSPTGVNTTYIDESKFDNVSFVSISSEVNLENGTKQAPYKSIKKAILNAPNGVKCAILVAAGVYADGTIELKEDVSLFGGYSPNDWSRDVQNNKTMLLGKDNERILVASNNTTIDGFGLSKAIYRGMGAAIYCSGTSPTITNNIFTGNVSLSPSNWNPKFWHETANNGGAIYGDNGASPIIENNIFLNNKTENGRGAAIAFDKNCDVRINKNVFLNNVAGTNDPMRSSDGGAISIFNWSKAEISDNIFLGNKALSKNDGGSIFIALWSSANIKDNILVASESGDDAGAIFVGGQEHRYGGAELDPIPHKDQFYVTINNNQFYGNRNSSMNSGAIRFTMEARGEFVNNILAFNNGAYFQRCEVAIKNNLIFDNFLFIETKDGLEKGLIKDNVIWGDFVLETPATVVGNNIRDGFSGGENNISSVPEIQNDWKNFDVTSTTINKGFPLTKIHVTGGKFKNNELVNKVVRASDHWGIIQSNTKNDLTVWGDLSNINKIQILPSYTLL